KLEPTEPQKVVSSEKNTQDLPYRPLIHNPKDDLSGYFFEADVLALSVQYTLNIDRDFEYDIMEATVHLMRFDKITCGESSCDIKKQSEGIEIDFTKYKKQYEIFLNVPLKIKTDNGAQILATGGIIRESSHIRNQDELKAAVVEYRKILGIEGKQIEKTEFSLVGKFRIKEKRRENIQEMNSETKRFMFSQTDDGDFLKSFDTLHRAKAA
ncbi:hypothetical protein CDIK_4439, partial [Cucumispora dikerogammari]